jgi:hypothetical protein
MEGIMVKKLFKAVLTVIVLIFLFTLANGYRTKKKLVCYCHETTAGTSLVSAKEKALQNGFLFLNYSSVDRNSNKAFVTASGVMGRYVCEIEHDGNRVVKTSLRFND